MISSALSRRCLPAIACGGICLLVTAVRAEPPDTDSDEGATSRSSTRWASEATQLIEELSDLANAYSRAAPPTSAADLKSNFEEYRHWPYSSEVEGSVRRKSPDRMLRKLWLLTGMPSLAYDPKKSFHEYYRGNALAYREYVAEHAELSEEALHRVGLANAIDSIGSPQWYMTLKYLAKRASLITLRGRGLRIRMGPGHTNISYRIPDGELAGFTCSIHIDILSQTPGSILPEWSLDDDAAYARLSAALSRWVKANETRMAWDPRQGMFRPLEGEYLETDDFFRVLVTELDKEFHSPAVRESCSKQMEQVKAIKEQSKGSGLIDSAPGATAGLSNSASQERP